MATWQVQRFMISSILDLVGDWRDSPDRALQGSFGTLGVPWKGAHDKGNSHHGNHRDDRRLRRYAHVPFRGWDSADGVPGVRRDACPVSGHADRGVLVRHGHSLQGSEETNALEEPVNFARILRRRERRPCREVWIEE